MSIRKLSDLGNNELSGRKVIVRMDFDVPEDDYSRIEASLPTVKYLLENSARLLLVGHKGRPEGIKDEKFTLSTLKEPLEKFTGQNVRFIPDFETSIDAFDERVFLFENLRFYKGEEENSPEFSIKLSSYASLYVNECFSTSHRAHSSFVGVPEHLPSYAGLRLISEVSQLGVVVENPRKPLVFVISGIKEDKIEMIKKVKKFADKVLVGGRLPEMIEATALHQGLLNDPKVFVARLNPDREDITVHSIEAFESEINKAGTIILAGAVGKYEDPGQTLGTKRVFESIAGSGAFKVAGGGDTEAALTTLNLTDKFDWISMGGGAMLNFLAGEKLPGVEALKE